MKYRIEIITYKNGRKEYTAAIGEKTRFFWRTIWSWRWINYKGQDSDLATYFETRQGALTAIDLNYAGNTEVQTIELEYINK